MGTGGPVPGGDLGGRQLEKALESLIESAQSTNRLLEGQTRGRDEMVESMRGLNKAMKPIGTIVKLAQSIFNLTVGAAFKYDKIILQNSDLNLNTRKILDANQVTAIGVGTFDEHLLAILKLQRIGFKDQAVSFRDNLILLDNQGGQGKLLVEYMAKLSQMGATNDSVEKVAQAVMEVANNTGTTARASIASLESMGDIVPLFKALGFEGDVLTGLVEATADMTEQGASQLGKFAKELLDPADIAKSFLVGGIEWGDMLLASIRDEEGPEEFKRIIAEAADSMSEAGSDLIGPFDQSVITLQKASDVFVGDAFKLAIATENAFKVAKSTAIQLDRSSGKHITGMEAYDDSIKKITDQVQRIVQFSTWEIFNELGPIIQAFSDELETFMLEGDIFTKITAWSDSLEDAIVSIAGIVRNLMHSKLARWLAGESEAEERVLDVMIRNSNLMKAGGTFLISRFDNRDPRFQYSQETMRDMVEAWRDDPESIQPVIDQLELMYQLQRDEAEERRVERLLKEAEIKAKRIEKHGAAAVYRWG